MATTARKVKNLYRGAFNLNRSPRVIYAYAYTERQAWAIMCKRLAERDGVPDSYVMNLFDGSKDNFSIIPEIIYEERG